MVSHITACNPLQIALVGDRVVSISLHDRLYRIVVALRFSFIADTNGRKYLGQQEPIDCQEFTTVEAVVDLAWCIRLSRLHFDLKPILT
jgi:hypothetical protein